MITVIPILLCTLLYGTEIRHAPDSPAMWDHHSTLLILGPGLALLEQRLFVLPCCSFAPVVFEALV